MGFNRTPKRNSSFQERDAVMEATKLPIALFCFCLICSVNARVEDEDRQGLIAWYRLDEGRGSVCHDFSGNRYDGKIKGGVWVKGQKGGALDFDGMNDYIDGGDSEKLHVDGALTLSVWLNTITRAQQYVISRYGWNIYLSGGDGIPHFETLLASRYGWDTLPASKPVPLGEWTFVAATFNLPTKRMAIYINGSLDRTKERSEGAFGGLWRSKLMIGRWTSGDSGFYFDGLIGEVRIYNRELSASEIQRLYQEGLQRYNGSLAPLPFRISLSPHLFFVKQKVAVDFSIRARKPGDNGFSVQVQLVSQGKVEPLQQREIKGLSPSKKAEVILPLTNLSPGEYEIRATLTDKKGSKLAEETSRFILIPKPWWLGSKEGISQKVLPPWTPLKVRREGSSLRVSCWGRTYSFSNFPFPAAIETAKRSILAVPIRVVAQADGREQKWQWGSVKLKEQTPAKVHLSQRVTSADLTLSAETLVEYDGMIRVDWKVEPRRKVCLEELTFEIPLRPEHAKYLYYYPDYAAPWEAHRPGKLAKEGVTMGFNPVIWLGDEERGLEWFCESDQNWHNANPKRAIEIVPNGKSVTLRLNLVTAPLDLSPAACLSSPPYTFGLQATPVKPVEKDAWDYRITWLYTPVYGFEKRQLNGELLIDRLAKLGLRTLALMDWTDILCYNAPTEPEKLRNFVRECHKHRMKVLVYFGSQMSERAPEFDAFLDECSMWMRSTSYSYGENPDNYPPKPTQQVYRVCYRSEWQDFVAAGIARLMDEYDIDGVYLDGTGLPIKCHNRHHGCGYEKPNGSVEGTFAIFDGRETVRRIYTVVKSRKPDGQVDFHNSGFMLIPVLGWATSYWDGEQLHAKPGTFPLERLPLDMFRTEFMGRQWGVPAEFLHYVLPCKFEDEWAFTLLHDVAVRGYDLPQIEFAGKIGRVFEGFGRKEGEWLPYWRNAEFVSISPDEAYASLYRHPKTGVLVVVSNLSRKEAVVTVKLDLRRLGLVGSVTAFDAMTNEGLTMEEGQIATPLNSLGWKLIWVRGEER